MPIKTITELRPNDIVTLHANGRCRSSRVVSIEQQGLNLNGYRFALVRLEYGDSAIVSMTLNDAELARGVWSGESIR